MTTSQTTAVSGLDNEIAGTVIRPSDDTWDAVRGAWNLSIDQHPLAVVEVTTAGDVEMTVRHARAAGLAVTAQPRGHGATQGRADGLVLIRTGDLDEITLDLANDRARIGAGVSTGALLDRLAGTGLAALAGTNPDVTVVGYLLGGGVSWFSRRFGIATTNVHAIELVDATGIPRRVTAANDPDLFWALRGGGGDFGIVTAVEIDLVRVTTIIGGRLLFPIGQAESVLRAFAELTVVAPTELTMFAGITHYPDLPVLPDVVRGTSFATIDVTYLGPEQGCETLLWTIRAAGTALLDTVGPVTIDQLGDVSAEPTAPSIGIDHAVVLQRLDDDSIARLLATVGDRDTTAMMRVAIRHLGGAIAAPERDGGVGGQVIEPYLLHALGHPSTPAMTEHFRADVTRLIATLGDVVVDRAPVNFLGQRTMADAYDAAALDRLRSIKRERDPHNVIRGNRPVLA